MDLIKLPETFETDRLLLQRLRYEDAEEIFFSYASKAEAVAYVSWARHETIQNTRNFLRYTNAAWRSKKDFSFSIRLKSDNRLIGSYGVLNEMGKIQFGYILGPLHWGNGYATEACIAVTEHLKIVPNIYRIGTYVDCEHTASMRVLEKCGFVQEAKLIKWMRFPNQGNVPKDCWSYILMK